MFFGFLKSAKEREIDKLKKQFENKEISQKSFMEFLYDIDRKVWYEYLSEKDKQVHDLNRDLLQNKITKEVHREKMKEIDLDRWGDLLVGEEKFLYETEKNLAEGKITREEYNKAMATYNKEPYIYIRNLQFNVDNTNNHSLEFDWNQFFIEDLRKNGYTGSTDEELVDKWFVALCTTIAAESDAVIVTNPDDLRKVRHDDKNKRTEHF